MHGFLDVTNEVITLKKKRTSNGFLQVSYTPEIIGPYEISILKNGLEVLGSPIKIYVSDPVKVKIEDLTTASLKDQIYAFKIDASEAGEGFIRVNIKGKLIKMLFKLLNFLYLSNYCNITILYRSRKKRYFAGNKSVV